MFKTFLKAAARKWNELWNGPANEEFDHLLVASTWNAQKYGAVRTVGTVLQAKRMIEVLVERYGVGAELYAFLQADRIERRLWGSDDVLGDTKDVHVIIPPQHRIGYVREESMSGYMLEQLETWDHYYHMLRGRDGRVIAATKMQVVRQESYRGENLI